MAGLLMKYPQPTEPVKIIAPVNAEILNVEVTRDRTPPSPAQAVPPQQTPSPPDAAPPPDVPPPIAVADPSILFPLQVKQSPIVPLAAPNKTSLPPVQHLVFGQGEGQQPAPEYPREAIIARQQGTVVVEFILDTDGHVQSAEATSPSPWPLLNQSALRTIQEQWSFPPGRVRRCDVSIVFQLKQN